MHSWSPSVACVVPLAPTPGSVGFLRAPEHSQGSNRAPRRPQVTISTPPPDSPRSRAWMSQGPIQQGCLSKGLSKAQGRPQTGTQWRARGLWKLISNPKPLSAQLNPE